MFGWVLTRLFWLCWMGFWTSFCLCWMGFWTSDRPFRLCWMGFWTSDRPFRLKSLTNQYKSGVLGSPGAKKGPGAIDFRKFCEKRHVFCRPFFAFFSLSRPPPGDFFKFWPKTGKIGPWKPGTSEKRSQKGLLFFSGFWDFGPLLGQNGLQMTFWSFAAQNPGFEGIWGQNDLKLPVCLQTRGK